MYEKIVLVLFLCFFSVFSLGCPGPEEKGGKEKEEEKETVIYCDETVVPMVHDLVRDYNLNTDKQINYKIVRKDAALSNADNESMNILYIGYFIENDDEKFEKELLAHDGIAVVVKDTNPLQSISVEQLRKIYTGRIINWNQLGIEFASNVYNDKRIIPVAYNDYGITLEKMFEDNVMNVPVRESFYTYVNFVNFINDAKSRINSDFAIGYLTGQSVTENLKILKLDGISLTLESLDAELYPLKVPINMHYKKDNKDAFKDIMKYLKSDDSKKL